MHTCFTNHILKVTKEKTEKFQQNSIAKIGNAFSHINHDTVNLSATLKRIQSKVFLLFSLFFEEKKIGGCLICTEFQVKSILETVAQ